MPLKSKEKNIIQTSFGKTIQTLRRKQNLTQEQLAERSGVNRSFIADLETGGRNLALKNILKLSIGLEFTPDKLMKKFTKQLELDNKGFDLKTFLDKEKWVERG
ncbi:helix-turn-helix domain-containing protein [bacterium]|nr:helix-turn-helix domain-containing protein [bacterium]